MKKYSLIFILIIVTTTIIYAQPTTPAAPDIPLPKVSIGFDKARGPADVAVTLQIIFLLTLITLAPAILVMVTSFIRIVIVLSFVRQALGTINAPPNQVIVALALFLTIFIMMPTFTKINNQALQPYLRGELSHVDAFNKGIEPLREFMFKNTRQKDIALFIHLAKIKRPRSEDEVPTYVLIPAFMISELKTAFQIGFVIFVPFLIIDMVIASTLMSMGMMMLPPILISLPFKILLFVMVDGWHLLTRSLVMSFH